jgi:hypothetical protein
VREAWNAEFGEPLEPSDCLVTGAGTCTAFRWVLHVPAVDYRRADPETGQPSGPSRVLACMRAAMREATVLASEHGLEGRFVLGAVLLGAGHGGLGEVSSADAMLRAVREAHEAGSPIGEVRFAVLTTSAARLIEHAAAKHGVPLASGSA